MVDYALGTDVCWYEFPVDAKLGYSRGLRFAAIRATVGDYYSDGHLRELWNSYKEAGCLVTAYLVTAPRDNTNTRRISIAAHLDRFSNTVSGLSPDLPWILDAELNRGEDKDYITQLQYGVALGLQQMLGKLPIIYTRMSWWDYYVNPHPLWAQCDLHAARYKDGLTGPWSDGACKFRDWKDWKFWQFKGDSADKTYWGFNSNGDLDYFNGTEAQLREYSGIDTPELTVEDKVNILWREAQKVGWNLER
jgi:GH25 family lysozyme M1 (1,4-beta-N-acetylmuramidase)